MALFSMNSGLFAQKKSFEVLPLGVYGGLDESNLSSYLVRCASDTNYICLDAGTLFSGLTKAKSMGSVSQDPIAFLQDHVSSFFISHPHLDHVAGLLMNAPDLKGKTIYGLPFTIDAIEKHYFSWDTWANFGDEGEKPALGNFHLEKLDTVQWISIPATKLSVKTFELSHATPKKSAAFLIKSANGYVLYFGDTGADSVEHSHAMSIVWKAIAPLIDAHLLKAVFLEVSFDNAQADKLLFGHLTPKWINMELQQLASLTNKNALQTIPFFVTHIKPENHRREKIEKELKAFNPLQINWQFPQQGRKIIF